MPWSISATLIEEPSAVPSTMLLHAEQTLEAWSGGRSTVGMAEAHSCVLQAAMVAAVHTSIAASQIEAQAVGRVAPYRRAVVGSCLSMPENGMDERESAMADP